MNSKAHVPSSAIDLVRKYVQLTTRIIIGSFIYGNLGNTIIVRIFIIIIGVAFEQGKTLPTPETVPFRLTRDIVDGMGIAGVEGVFRKCCEKTMSLMRAHQEELRTIVEVAMCSRVRL